MAKVINPKTGRLIEVGGAVWKKVLGNKAYAHTLLPSEYKKIGLKLKKPTKVLTKKPAIKVLTPAEYKKIGLKLKKPTKVLTKPAIKVLTPAQYNKTHSSTKIVVPKRSSPKVYEHTQLPIEYKRKSSPFKFSIKPPTKSELKAYKLTKLPIDYSVLDIKDSTGTPSSHSSHRYRPIKSEAFEISAPRHRRQPLNVRDSTYTPDYHSQHSRHPIESTTSPI